MLVNEFLSLADYFDEINREKVNCIILKKEVGRWGWRDLINEFLLISVCLKNIKIGFEWKGGIKRIDELLTVWIKS